MNKKAKLFFLSGSILTLAFVFMVVYLQNVKTLDSKKLDAKNSFLSIVKLPDIAISTESYFIRHRSLVNIHDIFLDAPEHIEYFPTTFSINHNINTKKAQ